jgi:hypothetical protein
MKEKRISKPTPKADVPYDAANAGKVTAFWETALSHRGVKEIRAKCGDHPRRKQIAKSKLRCGLMLMCSLGVGALVRAGRPV